MSQELERLHNRLNGLEAELHAERKQNCRERRRLRVQAGLAFVALIGTLFLSPANRNAIAQAQGAVFPAIYARLSALETKTQFQSASSAARTTTFTACNVVITNGLGTTSTVNGLGNLTLGYNAPGRSNGDVRTGSHNLVVGDYANYSSYGGAVIGYGNAITAPYASVSGGYYNEATNSYASVSGGFINTASGTAATVSGGAGRQAEDLANWAAGRLFQDQ